MRVSDSQFTIMINQAMMKNNAAINKVAEQLSTGEVINNLSDDPGQMVKLEGLNKVISSTQQYQQNISSVQSQYQAYETYMDTLHDIGLEVNDLLLQGNNGTLDPESSKGIVTELTLLKQQALDTINKKNDGNYLFSGTAVDQPAISTEPPYEYLGNSKHRETKVNESQLIQSNFTAEEVLGGSAGSDFFMKLDAAIAELESPTENFNATMQNALDATDVFRSNVNSSISVLGSNYASMDRLQGNNEDTELYATTVQNDINALDYTEASTRLSLNLASLEAMQKTFMTVSGTNSLFDLM